MIKIPNDWYNVSEDEAKEYVAYLLQNYKKFELKCSPYNQETNTGLCVYMNYYDSTNNFDNFVQIGKRLSDTYKRGGRATQGWVVYDANDYGYSYDGYCINGKDIFINQKHALWPEEYPMENPLYKSVHKLYLAIREATLPTYEQQKKFQQQKADRLKAQKAQMDLLNQMYNEGNISKNIFDMYTSKIK